MTSTILTAEAGSPQANAAPIAHAERSLAPDIARGFMLLFIALANVGIYITGHTLDDYGNAADASLFDRVALFVEQLIAADRSRPMFAILYGFGIAVMASRMYARGLGAKQARKVLRRRSWWLIAFGLVHSTFLFSGDILAMYGATGLIALGFVHVSNRALKRWFWISFAWMMLVLPPLMMGLVAIDDGAPKADADGSNYLVAMGGGAASTVFAVLVAPLTMMFISLVIAGIALQRSGWLTNPADHVSRLRKVFIWGMVVNIASSAPGALIALGAWHPSETLVGLAELLTFAGGMVAGLGYICGFALLAHRWSARGRRGVPGALAALGERSLTGYLGQSIIMAPLLSTWGFGVGEGLGFAAAAAIAVGAWTVTLLVAMAMDRKGIRGPFEVVLRRLVYGKVSR